MFIQTCNEKRHSPTNGVCPGFNGVPVDTLLYILPSQRMICNALAGHSMTGE